MSTSNIFKWNLKAELSRHISDLITVSHLEDDSDEDCERSLRYIGEKSERVAKEIREFLDDRQRNLK